MAEVVREEAGTHSGMTYIGRRQVTVAKVGGAAAAWCRQYAEEKQLRSTLDEISQKSKLIQ